MRFSVDGWEPQYGTASDVQNLEESSAAVDVTLERNSGDWSPIEPEAATTLPSAVLFVDGVRRIDARAWIDDGDSPDEQAYQVASGLCASYAAGVVCCCAEGAHILDYEVRRGLFTDAVAAEAIQTSSHRYTLQRTVRSADAASEVAQTNALQRALTTLEVTVAVSARTMISDHTRDEQDLLIVDGPLRDRAHLPRALGYVKTHYIQYLPKEFNAVVAALPAGARTPVFAIGSGWERYSWYLRLPCLPAGPWTGIVRLEAPMDLPVEQVCDMANMTQVLVGRYASVEYKDGRAPQNLVPIGGLEKTLKHLLGSASLLYREIRAVARSG